MKHIYILLLSIGLVACGSLFPQPGEPSKKYTLSNLTDGGDGYDFSKCKHPYQLIVDLPLVYPPIDSTRIALKPQERTIDYYADVEWGDRLSAIIQESVIYSLQNANKFRAVSRPTEGVQADYILKIEVRKFYIAQGPTPTSPQIAEVDYMAHLVKLPERRIMTSQKFSQSLTIRETTMDSIIKTLNEAHLSATRSMIPWLMGCLHHRSAEPDVRE